ncbi:hypothetical protein [Streptomyces platensis]|uniref:hypothetical protein n=1 Tax=Streptomyces platensis TaxID=58346 RepID=UPI002E26D4C8
MPGALSAGLQVVCELNDRLEGFVADEPRPTTPAGLFTLASYASALGWLTESLAELTTSVDQICTRAGIPTEPQDPDDAAPDGAEQDGECDFAFSALELAAIRTVGSSLVAAAGPATAIAAAVQHSYGTCSIALFVVGAMPSVPT